MSEKKTVIDKAKVTIKGTCEFEELFKHLYRYLSWRKYDVVEKKYKEKWTGAAKEIEIEWQCTRDADEYTRLEIDINFLLLGIADVKIPKEGGEVKAQKGEFNIEVSAILVKDYDDRWEQTSVLKFFKSFFEKYLYYGTLEDLKKTIWREGWEIHNEIKAFVNLYKYER